MKRIVGFISMLAIVITSAIALCESHAILLPDIIYESFEVTSAKDVLDSYIDIMGGIVETESISQSRVVDYFVLRNGTVDTTNMDKIVYEMYKKDGAIYQIRVDVEILQPFGQNIEESQTYIDTVNYFQSMYGRATGSDNEKFAETNKRIFGRDYLRWKDDEKNLKIAVLYADGNVSENKSPYIEILLEQHKPKL